MSNIRNLTIEALIYELENALGGDELIFKEVYEQFGEDSSYEEDEAVFKKTVKEIKNKLKEM